MTNIGAMEESGPLEGDRAAKNQRQAQLSFTFAGAEVGREQCAREITSLAVPRALSATCLNLRDRKRSSRSSPLPRTDRRYTKSTVAVCAPLICSESNLHHVFAYNFFHLQARIQLPPTAVRTQRATPAIARIQLWPPPGLDFHSHTNFATRTR